MSRNTYRPETPLSTSQDNSLVFFQDNLNTETTPGGPWCYSQEGETVLVFPGELECKVAAINLRSALDKQESRSNGLRYHTEPGTPYDDLLALPANVMKILTIAALPDEYYQRILRHEVSSAIALFVRRAIESWHSNHPTESGESLLQSISENIHHLSLAPDSSAEGIGRSTVNLLKSTDILPHIHALLSAAYTARTVATTIAPRGNVIDHHDLSMLMYASGKGTITFPKPGESNSAQTGRLKINLANACVSYPDQPEDQERDQAYIKKWGELDDEDLRMMHHEKLITTKGQAIATKETPEQFTLLRNPEATKDFAEEKSSAAGDTIRTVNSEIANFSASDLWEKLTGEKTDFSALLLEVILSVVSRNKVFNGESVKLAKDAYLATYKRLSSPRSYEQMEIPSKAAVFFADIEALIRIEARPTLFSVRKQVEQSVKEKLQRTEDLLDFNNFEKLLNAVLVETCSPPIHHQQERTSKTLRIGDIDTTTERRVIKQISASKKDRRGKDRTEKIGPPVVIKFIVENLRTIQENLDMTSQGNAFEGLYQILAKYCTEKQAGTIGSIMFLIYETLLSKRHKEKLLSSARKASSKQALSLFSAKFSEQVFDQIRTAIIRGKIQDNTRNKEISLALFLQAVLTTSGRTYKTQVTQQEYAGLTLISKHSTDLALEGEKQYLYIRPLPIGKLLSYFLKTTTEMGVSIGAIGDVYLTIKQRFFASDRKDSPQESADFLYHLYQYFLEKHQFGDDASGQHAMTLLNAVANDYKTLTDNPNAKQALALFATRVRKLASIEAHYRPHTQCLSAIPETKVKNAKKRKKIQPPINLSQAILYNRREGFNDNDRLLFELARKFQKAEESDCGEGEDNSPELGNPIYSHLNNVMAWKWFPQLNTILLTVLKALAFRKCMPQLVEQLLEIFEYLQKNTAPSLRRTVVQENFSAMAAFCGVPANLNPRVFSIIADKLSTQSPDAKLKEHLEKAHTALQEPHTQRNPRLSILSGEEPAKHHDEKRARTTR